MLKELFISSVSAAFEWQNDLPYYTEKEYTVYLDGKEAYRGNTNVFSIFDLSPGTEYILTSDAFEGEMRFTTKAETCAVSVVDFGAVGDVSVKVIGADGQPLDMQVPVRCILEQLIAKLGIPPFMLGLSWSTTERMSSQQADILTSELEAYRRYLTPVIIRILRIWAGLNGICSEFVVKWHDINLQDEVELARAELLRAQAKERNKR